MKKTYTTPVILTNGTVVQQTLTTEVGLCEPINQKDCQGSIGFNL